MGNREPDPRFIVDLAFTGFAINEEDYTVPELKSDNTRWGAMLEAKNRGEDLHARIAQDMQ